MKEITAYVRDEEVAKDQYLTKLNNNAFLCKEEEATHYIKIKEFDTEFSYEVFRKDGYNLSRDYGVRIRKYPEGDFSTTYAALHDFLKNVQK